MIEQTQHAIVFTKSLMFFRWYVVPVHFRQTQFHQIASKPPIRTSRCLPQTWLRKSRTTCCFWSWTVSNAYEKDENKAFGAILFVLYQQQSTRPHRPRCSTHHPLKRRGIDVIGVVWCCPFICLRTPFAIQQTWQVFILRKHNIHFNFCGPPHFHICFVRKLCWNFMMP